MILYKSICIYMVIKMYMYMHVYMYICAYVHIFIGKKKTSTSKIHDSGTPVSSALWTTLMWPNCELFHSLLPLCCSNKDKFQYFLCLHRLVSNARLLAAFEHINYWAITLQSLACCYFKHLVSLLSPLLAGMVLTDPLEGTELLLAHSVSGIY